MEKITKKLVIFTLIKPMLLSSALISLSMLKNNEIKTTGKTKAEKSIPLSKSSALEETKALILNGHFRHQDLVKMMGSIRPVARKKFYRSIQISHNLISQSIDLHMKIEKSHSNWKGSYTFLKEKLNELEKIQVGLIQKLSNKEALKRNKKLFVSIYTKSV